MPELKWPGIPYTQNPWPGLHSGQNSFYSSLKKMTDYYDFPGFNCNLLNKCKIKQYVDLMQKKYISYWNHAFNIHKNLTFIIKSKRIIALLPT